MLSLARGVCPVVCGQELQVTGQGSYCHPGLFLPLSHLDTLSKTVVGGSRLSGFVLFCFAFEDRAEGEERVSSKLHAQCRA